MSLVIQVVLCEEPNEGDKSEIVVLGESGLYDSLNGEDRGNTLRREWDQCFFRIVRRLGSAHDKGAKGGHQYETEEFFIVGDCRLSAHRTFNRGTIEVSADTPGIWKLTGSMATSRRLSQFYTLPNGTFLVVGGTNTTGVDGTASTFYATSEIYDPATGIWSATGSLTTGGRVLHTASYLTGGKILIAGGWNGSAALSSAEIYDPATGSFSPTGSMTTARAYHRSWVLFDGRVLITGGFDSSGAPIASAETYNPATGIFSATAGPMAAARSDHRMNIVGDGKILVTGGFGAGGVELATAELFNPATGTFTAAGSLVHARAHHGATALPSGEILVTGGHGGGGVLSSTEIYDPDTNAFTAGPTLKQARQSHASQLLPNGKVLIAGGNNNTSGDWDIQTSFLSSAEIYDPATHTFTTTGSKTNATTGGTFVLLWTGKFLLAGGGTNEAELYTPEMPGTLETWVATGNMVTARTGHLWNLLDDGRVFIVGGLDSSGNPLASAELYDYLTGKFSSTGNMATPRQHHRTVLLYTGKVLVTGGRPSATANVLNSGELYDPVSGIFTPTGDMQRYRRLHRSTELLNGKILITGGLGGTLNTANSILNGAELYNPATGTFTFTTGNMTTARYNHQAILLYTGKVLIAGGYGPSGTTSVLLNSAELYDPATNTFSSTGNMITARNSPFLTRLPNDKILVSNGSDAAGNTIQALEIYDPATGTFTAAGNELVARNSDRVNRLVNGKIILVGGQTTADAASVTNSTELYSQVTGRFSASGNLLAGRQGFAQSGLPNGRILAAGGTAADGTTVLSSAELYTPLIADEVDTTITSGPDTVTSSTSATFNFTSTDPNSTFTCSLDGSPFVLCTSGQTYSSLADGRHNFQVHATDSLGNTDPTPANYDWTIAPCAYTISPANKTFNAKGGSVSINVSATGQTNCPAPLVVEDAEWISVSGTPTWKANKGTVKIAVQNNPSSQSRTGVVSIGGQNLTIQEDGAICQLTALKPSSGKYPNTGGSGSFDITVSPQDCSWNVATTLDWIHLDTTTGTGNGTAAFHMDANATGKNRTGKIDVSLAQNATKKKTFTVNESK